LPLELGQQVGLNVRIANARSRGRSGRRLAARNHGLAARNRGRIGWIHHAKHNLVIILLHQSSSAGTTKGDGLKYTNSGKRATSGMLLGGNLAKPRYN
jgi:hypothetical protein